MRQILAILWDSYRLLTAKKMFWIVLFISVLIAMSYASVGFTPEGVSVLFGAYEMENEFLTSDSLLAEYFYMMIFTDYLVPWWLGMFALVLALISVCSVFPDFLKGGSIDVAVSKPVSRVTLFLVKYAGSLLFVAIQVAVFSLIVFLAQGLRIGHWNG
jgi:ABC-type transport system involved in multi-copper enzyme maturation permease subunit